MTVHECRHHHHRHSRRKLIIGAAAVGGVVALTILITWAILRPTKPHFTLQDATVYALNATASPPPLLTVNLQLTVAARNPNRRAGVYYGGLRVFATLRGQQVTLPTLIPSTYQGHRDVAVWSPFVYGDSVPVAPDIAAALGGGRSEGMEVISVKVIGRIRYRVGRFVSKRYRLNVDCPLFVSFGGYNGNFQNTIVVGPLSSSSTSMKYRLIQSCHVDV